MHNFARFATQLSKHRRHCVRAKRNEGSRHLLLFAEQTDPLVDHVELDQLILAGIAYDPQGIAAFAHDLDLLAQDFP
jgi:hypothetical protein